MFGAHLHYINIEQQKKRLPLFWAPLLETPVHAPGYYTLSKY